MITLTRIPAFCRQIGKCWWGKYSARELIFDLEKLYVFLQIVLFFSDFIKDLRAL